MTAAIVPPARFVAVQSAAGTSNRVHLRVLVAVFFVAVLCRIVALGLVQYHVDRKDAGSYHISAVNLLEHGVYSLSGGPPYVATVYRPPLYPAAVAGVYAVVGVRPSAVQAVQVVLSALIVCLFGLAVSRLSPVAGVFSMWAWALWPPDMLYAGALLSEVLCAALLTTALAAAVLLTQRVRAVVAGGALGALALTRDTYLLLPMMVVGLAVVYALWRPGGASILRHAIVALLVAGAVIAPWTARNYALTGRIIPVSEGRLGLALWMGGWATDDNFTLRDTAGGRVWPPEAFHSEDERRRLSAPIADTPAGMRELDRAYREAFFARFRAEPLQVVGRWIRRAPQLWTGTRTEIFDFRPDWAPRGSVLWFSAKGVTLALNSAMLLAATAGLILAWRRRSALIWLAVPLVYTALVHLPLHSFENRFSQPVFMFLFPFAGLSIDRLAALIGRRRRAPRGAQ